MGKTIQDEGTELRDFTYSTPSNHPMNWHLFVLCPINIIQSDVSCQVVDPSEYRDSTSNRGDVSCSGWHVVTGSKSRENVATLFATKLYLTVVGVQLRWIKRVVKIWKPAKTGTKKKILTKITQSSASEGETFETVNKVSNSSWRSLRTKVKTIIQVEVIRS